MKAKRVGYFPNLKMPLVCALVNDSMSWDEIAFISQPRVVYRLSDDGFDTVSCCLIGIVGVITATAAVVEAPIALMMATDNGNNNNNYNCDNNS